MSQPEQVTIGVAWYREEEWSLLRSLVADTEKLEATHAEWLAMARHRKPVALAG